MKVSLMTDHLRTEAFTELEILQSLCTNIDSSGGDIDRALNILSRYQTYSNEKLCILFQNSETIPLFKKLLHEETSLALKSSSINAIGNILVRIFLVFHFNTVDTDFEAYTISAESQSDIHRLKEDVLDFVQEELKFIFNLLLNVKVTEDIRFSAGCVAAAVLRIYHHNYQAFQEATDLFIGNQDVSMTNLLLSQLDPFSRVCELRGLLGPLIDLLLTATTPSDDKLHYFMQLYEKARTLPSSSSNTICIIMVNDWLLFILSSLSESPVTERVFNRSTILLLNNHLESQGVKSKALFMLEESELNSKKDLLSTARSSSDLTISILAFIEDWANNVLMKLVRQSISPLEMANGLKSIVMFLRHGICHDSEVSPYSLLIVV